jgi:hypothetical protein
LGQADAFPGGVVCRRLNGLAHFPGEMQGRGADRPIRFLPMFA